MSSSCTHASWCGGWPIEPYGRCFAHLTPEEKDLHRQARGLPPVASESLPTRVRHALARAKGLPFEKRDDAPLSELLAWAADQPDHALLATRFLGRKGLAWIRAHQPAGDDPRRLLGRAITIEPVPDERELLRDIRDTLHRIADAVELIALSGTS